MGKYSLIKSMGYDELNKIYYRIDGRKIIRIGSKIFRPYGAEPYVIEEEYVNIENDNSIFLWEGETSIGILKIRLLENFGIPEIEVEKVDTGEKVYFPHYYSTRRAIEEEQFELI